MQYHEVKLSIQLASAVKNVATGDGNMSLQVFVDYVYLDTDERRRFAQVSHEYLIQQLQFTGDETVAPTSAGGSLNVKLNFNHPTKFLAWVFKGADHGQYLAIAPTAGATFKPYAEQLAILKSAKLQLNGHDRFSERKGSYFNQVVPWQTLRNLVPSGVYMYSFSLKPDEHQPSGSCNFSRIDNAVLNLSIKAHTLNAANVAQVKVEDQTVTTSTGLTALKVFAENYNVFRIMSGMGGLAYSN